MKINSKLLKKTTVLIAAGLFMTNQAYSAATFTIQIADGPGEGFNDTTPATPVGGNTGTTLGEQRLAIFTRAGEIWGETINSTVPIVINAQFDPLTPCAPGGSVLGSAGPLTIHADFANAPIADTWYGQALANSLSGVDLDIATADINATFNSEIDNGCSGSVGWYYGLDGATPADRIALLPVLLHELGHGLGFSTFTSNQTGAFFSGRPDIWTEFLFDLATNTTWRDLPSNAARQASAISDPDLVWNGPNVNAAFPDVLGNPNQLTVNSPASIAGNNVVQAASYGPAVPELGLTADVILINDNSGASTTDGCEPIINDLSGAIALIDRGSCNFTAKSINAQNAGAIGVLIANNAAPGLPPMGGADPAVTVPSIGITQQLGADIQTELLSGPVNVTMNYDLTNFAGTNGGFVRMNAPDPVVPGSSVSHWTPDTSPNLLMEPSITATIFDEVDLTRELFIDIGWSVVSNAIPDITVTKTATLTTDNGHLGEADEGDVITFSVSVENTGNVALTALVVNDSMEGQLTCTPTDLAASEIATCTDYTYTVLASDIVNGGTIDNTADASMTDAGNPNVIGSASTQTVINQSLFKDGFEDLL